MPGNPNFDSLLSTTLNRHMPTLKDLITNKNPVLYMINKLGGKRTEDGGAAWIQGLDFTVNPTIKAMGQFDILDTTSHDPFTSAKFEPKIVTGTYQITRFQEWQNSGSKTRIHAWLKGLVNNLRRSFQNELDIEIHGDGTLYANKAIGGLQLLVEEGTAWSVVGDIDSNLYNQWRNQWFAGGVFSSTGIRNWTKMYNNCSRGSEIPNLIETTQLLWELYHLEMTKVARVIVNKELVDLGFRNLEFMGTPVMFNPNVPTGYTYFLNLESLHYVVGSGYDLEIGPLVEPYNSIGRFGKAILFANMTVSDRARNGVITAQTET